MSSRANANPLLFPASTDSAFDELQASAVLIPPTLSEPQLQGNVAGEESSFLGQHPLPEAGLSEHFGNSSAQDSTFGRVPPTAPPPASNVLTFSEVTPSFAKFSQPPSVVSSVIPPYHSSLSGGISSYPPPCSNLPRGPTPPFGSLPRGPTPPYSTLLRGPTPPFGSLPRGPTPPYSNLPRGPTPPCSNLPRDPVPPQGVFPGSGPYSDVRTATPPPSSLVMGSSQSRRSVPAGPPPMGPPPVGPPPVAPPLVPLPTFPQGTNNPLVNPAKLTVETTPGSDGNPIMEPQLPIPAHENSPFIPTKNTILPASFENMASNPQAQDGMYHPVMHHWFYAVGKPQVWKPFSFKDSLNLEEAFKEASPEIIATDGGRYDVNIKEHLRKPIYWEEEPGSVRRCSWFRKGPLEAQPIPYEEEVAEKLEAEYRDAMMTGQWHRQIDLKGGDRIMIHSTRTMIHYVGLDGELSSGVSVNGAHSPLSVKRGTEDFEIMDGEADVVDHVLFLVHGIGSVCDLRFRRVEECVDDFRGLGNQLLASHFKQSCEMGLVGRVEILPVSWHKALHGEATGIDKKLTPITLRSIPKLRDFTNDTILDVLLFTSPIYCQHIMDTVASELNRLYNLFCERNPTFNGLVSLGGHSLGSVILFDLLMNQSADSQDKEEESPAAKEECCAFDRGNPDAVSSPINYVIGGYGTGQPSIVYPKLIFKPEAFFLMGSPYAMFITVRGIDTIGVDYELPTCKRVFNIFHPFDPVAYRLETLIDPDLINLRPVLIPHHKGRKRMHLELKETIERVGTEFKQKIVDSIQGTWNRLYQLYSGSSSKSIEHEVDEALANQLYLDEEDTPGMAANEQNTPVGCLNGGRRIDYVLQEKPYESFNEYIFALQAHVTYWESEDTMLLILKELYGPCGISCDSESQQTQLSTQFTSDGDSALGSGTVTPSSPPMFDVTTNTLQYPSSSESTSQPASSPVPLFTTAPTSPTNMTSFPSNLSFPSNPSSPSVISGRPVVDINHQPKGMDPTAMPGEKATVGPPPKLPSGTFTRSSPFRR